MSFPNYAFLYLKRKMNETRIYVTAIYVKQIFSIFGFFLWIGPPAVAGYRISSLLISVHLVQVRVELTPCPLWSHMTLVWPISSIHLSPSPQYLLHGHVNWIGSIRHIPVLTYLLTYLIFWKKEASHCLDTDNLGMVHMSANMSREYFRVKSISRKPSRIKKRKKRETNTTIITKPES